MTRPSIEPGSSGDCDTMEIGVQPTRPWSFDGDINGGYL